MDLQSLVATLACVGLGLHAGAQLAEAGLLVPFWRSLAPRDFLDWYERFGGLTFRFFSPLASSAALLTIGAAERSDPGDVSGLLQARERQLRGWVHRGGKRRP